MLTILFNNNPLVENQRDRYYSYADNYNNQQLKDSISRETGTLHAKYKGTCSSLGTNMPDLDNILLYNMKLDTSNYSTIILEKEVSTNRIDTEYDSEYFYDVDKNNPVIPEKSVIDTGYLEFPEEEPTGEGSKVIFFYNLFREWLCKKDEIEIESIRERLKDKDLELVICYNGPSNLSESGFIKRIIDGVISAMEDFKPSNSIKENYRQAIEKGIIRPVNYQTSILPSDGHYLINGNGWSPQDHLLSRIVIIKNSKGTIANAARFMISGV